MRNQLLHILVADRDTTAGLLGWLFLLLARDPAEYTRLRAAVLASFSPYSDDFAASNLTASALRGCAPLQHALDEALRLFPLVQINLRKCLVSSTTLPRSGRPRGKDPVYVTVGDDILYTTVNMHQAPAVCGPDADVFRPARWHGSRVKASHR